MMGTTQCLSQIMLAKCGSFLCYMMAETLFPPVGGKMQGQLWQFAGGNRSPSACGKCGAANAFNLFLAALLS